MMVFFTDLGFNFFSTLQFFGGGAGDGQLRTWIKMYLQLKRSERTQRTAKELVDNVFETSRQIKQVQDVKLSTCCTKKIHILRI